MEAAVEVTPSKRPESPPSLPEHPIATIEAGRKWALLDLKSLWAYRELLYFLTWRDVKVRYKQTLLGVVWVILQPLLAMLTFSIFFGKLVGVASDGIPYALFAYTALLPWMFFSKAVTSGGSSLVNSAHLITKIYFPRLIIPGATVLSGLVDFAVAFVLLILLMLYYGVGVTLNILLLPLLILLTVLFALGVGLWTSAMNVRYRDIGAVLPFAVQMWMFVTPIIYPLSLVPQKWRWLMTLNPMTGIIEGYRSALLGTPCNWSALAFSATVTLILLFYSSYTFRRMESHFADIV